MGTKVRILSAVVVGGIEYKPNQVVDLPAATAKALAADGQVDPNKEAVAYCINALGAEIIVHRSAPSQEAQQLLLEISLLEAKVAETAEGDRPALQDALDEKRAALAAIS